MTRWRDGDRRKGADIWVRTLNILAITAWSCFVVALVLFHYARPELETGVARYFNLSVRDNWIVSLKVWLEGFLVLCCVFSLISMGINFRRLRRKGDRFQYNLIILLLVAVSFLLMLFVSP